MRRETLFKRLAEKTNTPILEQILLGEVSREELPTDCMVWTGAKNGHTTRRQKVNRSRTHGLKINFVGPERPSGLVKWQGKQQPVQRLLFLLLYKPGFNFKMKPQCPTTLCVNPLHFEIHETHGGALPPPPSDIPPMPDFDAPWTMEEVENHVDLMLVHHEPKCWDDVVSLDIMIDVPRDMLKQHLISIHKGHLT